QLIEKHRETDQNILIVAHGNTIRNLLNGIVPELEMPTSVDNASVSVVNYHDGQYHLERFNDTGHFR
ncbi:MAG: histidine phosphatase family protein, partial [Carnobacterium sp.]